MDTKQSMPCVPKALSCEYCHKRKVKCDKVPGHCSNCAKAGIRCTVRNRKKNAKKEDARLLLRLSMLEELVQDLRNGEARNNNTTNSLQNGKRVYPGSLALNDETRRLILEKGRSRYVDLGQACLMRYATFRRIEKWAFWKQTENISNR